MNDLLVINGTIIDGTGGPRFRGDVAIARGRITAVGPTAATARAKKTIDATGMIVSPGIIDIHTHADITLYHDNAAAMLAPLVRQGVTTVVGGNCGFGLAPFDPEHRPLQEEYLATVTNISLSGARRWTTMEQWMRHIGKRDLVVNTALLAPHGIIRLGATGEAVHDITQPVMRRMKRDLEACMDAGALGLSTGLQYFPGLLSTTDELRDLAGVLAKYDGVFTCHLRSYTSTTIKRAFDEVYAIIGPAGIRGQISHIFAIPWKGLFQRPYLAAVRFMIRHAETSLRLFPESLITMDQRTVLGYYHEGLRAGLRVGMDIMPTATGFTPLLAFFPSWIIRESNDYVLRMLADPAVRREIKKDILRGTPAWPHDGKRNWSLNLFKQLGFECSHIMGVASEKNRHLEGRSLAELAREARKHPVDYACDLLIEEQGRVLTFESLGEPEDPFTAVAQYPPLFDPQVSIVTDTLLMGYGRPSYLFYGAYPRFYGHYTRGTGRIGLEAAVRKCTALPAAQMGIAGRGMVRVGCHADLLIFDEATIGTGASFHEPALPPQGIDRVIINGKIVVEKDRVVTSNAGTLVRRGE